MKARFRKWYATFFTVLFRFYLWIVRNTSSLEVIGMELIKDACIIGFWHQNCGIMNLVLQEIVPFTKEITVLITSAPRGDVIENLVEYFGASGFRIEYNGKGATSLRQIIRKAQDVITVAVAMDGPLGPACIPKKLPFMIAAYSGKAFVGIDVHCERCFHVPWRWDKYAIPLPFSKIQAEIKYLSAPTKADLKELPALQQTVTSKM